MTRRTPSQFWSFKICRRTFLKYTKFADLLILRLSNCERVRRVAGNGLFELPLCLQISICDSWQVVDRRQLTSTALFAAATYVRTLVYVHRDQPAGTESTHEFIYFRNDTRILRCSYLMEYVRMYSCTSEAWVSNEIVTRSCWSHNGTKSLASWVVFSLLLLLCQLVLYVIHIRTTRYCAELFGFVARSNWLLLVYTWCVAR